MTSEADLVRPAMAWCPCPDDTTARFLAHSLLDEKLIVCANIGNSIYSIYEWDGERGESAEVGLLMKTEAKHLQALCDRVETLHPYDAAVVIGWNVDTANASALEWIGMMGQSNG